MDRSRTGISGSKVLVTGGAGFIGSTLADDLVSAGAEQVVVVDNMFLGSDSNLASAQDHGLVLYRDDAEHYHALRSIIVDHRIDIVFNCATKALNYSFVNPHDAFDTNVRVVLNLLELLRDGRFATLCHFSTSEVYGTAVYEPMDERHPRNPTTAYAAGKAAADLAVESWVRMFDVDAIIVRPFNNYGPRQNARGPLAAVIPVTIDRIARGMPPVIHGDGSQSRDFIFVQDTVDAVMRLYGVTPRGESVNVATQGQITISDLVARICGIMGYAGPIERQPPRPSDVRAHDAAVARMHELIDFVATPFDVGLARTLEWYMERRAP